MSKEKTLFQAIQEAGIPYSNHESDLHFPVTDESTEILTYYDLQYKNATVFISNIDNKRWYDVPFGYDPYWNKVPLERRVLIREHAKRKINELLPVANQMIKRRIDFIIESGAIDFDNYDVSQYILAKILLMDALRHTIQGFMPPNTDKSITEELENLKFF